MTLPLHPRGTLRARFSDTRVAAADIFRRLGVGARRCDLGDEGLYLAEELVQADAWIGGTDPEALAVLVLALMLAQRQGSTRLPLDPRGPLRALVADIGRVAGYPIDVARTLKTIGALTGAPRFNSVIGVGDARLPLIVDGGYLYTERTRWLEIRVARQLAARMTAAVGAPDAVLADLFARPGAVRLSAEQQAAVTRALGARLAVVTGGPGTGKTLVAASIVRGLARLGCGPIALAAQTGKAANRLTTVIAEQLAAIADPSDVDRALALAPPAAQTLHRLLGARGGHFAHHAQSPLPVGALIIDEASMVDLQMMDAVLDALPAGAPLILIGDAHQLPAIDAGQILADLAQPGAATSGRVAVLEHSHRMERGRAILDAAAAVRGGHADRLTEKRAPLATARTPGTLTWQGVEWVDTAAAARPHEATLAVTTALWHHFEGPRAHALADQVFRFHDGHVEPADRAALEHLWHLLGRARALTVTRAQEAGSIAINAHLHALALERMTMAGRPDFVPGEPVMITANDYQRGLFNGDQGIIVRADEGLGGHRFRAVFRISGAAGGELVPFAIEALRDRLELAWALTVHKAQGSELDAVAVLLPHDDIPLLTRELLYTGITRARTGVVIAGARPILTAAGKRGALRESGLPERLAAALR